MDRISHRIKSGKISEYNNWLNKQYVKKKKKEKKREMTKEHCICISMIYIYIYIINVSTSLMLIERRIFIHHSAQSQLHY